MELREWATQILSGSALEDKLFVPPLLTDENPGSALLFEEPTRPPSMGFQKKKKQEKLPPFHLQGHPDNRAICLHRFAGHELLAVEIMAQALLAFPKAPKAFRRGVANTLKEEQGHVRLYMQRMEELGLKFGDLPLYRYFWNQVPHLKTPTHYVSVMSLTFEMANLDFAPLYGKSFAHFGDTQSAALMEQILLDEIRHVSFGWHMFKRFSKDASTWDGWAAHLPPRLEPKRAKGFVLMEENRRKAGIPEEWIAKMKEL